MNEYLAWFGFWIFMSVFIACDSWVFVSGRDSFFQAHKTEAEKALQKKKADSAGEGP